MDREAIAKQMQFTVDHISDPQELRDICHGLRDKLIQWGTMCEIVEKELLVTKARLERCMEIATLFLNHIETLDPVLHAKITAILTKHEGAH